MVGGYWFITHHSRQKPVGKSAKPYGGRGGVDEAAARYGAKTRPPAQAKPRTSGSC